ncbi:MAG TPA: hypothetical protein VFI31_28420, partial [Pirellulales bacterium]|nr:hypothetical protein [Pirellulales bacterium]
YRLEMVVERVDGRYGIGPVLLVGGQQVTAAVDGWDGSHTGLEAVDGKSCNDNETTHRGRLLNLGKPFNLVFFVHPNSVLAAVDGEQILNWAGDASHLSMIREWALPDKTRLGLSVHATVCRISKLEITALAPEPTSPSPTAIAGGSIDLLKQVDVKRDSVNGDWTLVDGVLVSPDTAYARLTLPPPPGAEYQLTVVAERLKGKRGHSAALVVDGHQTMATVDGYDGKHSGLQNLDGKDCHENESTHKGRLLTDGKPAKFIYTVRRGGVEVTVDGTKIIDWHGDAGRLSMDSRWALPDVTRLGLCTYSAACRFSKIEVLPLAPEPPTTTPRVATTSPEKSTAGVLKIFEDEPEFVSALNVGEGQAVLTQNERYAGKASVMVMGKQRYCEALPGLNVRIRKSPQGPDEYRYLRFAWKKHGGEEIFVQLHYPSNWFRYCAGTTNTLGPAVKISDQLPADFVVVTRDLATDFGEFDFNGLALSAVDGDWACFDHIYLGRTIKDLDSIDTPRTKTRERIFPDIASDSGREQRAPPPDEDAIKKARQEMQKNFSSALKAAKSPDQKRSLAQELAEKAALEDKGAPYAYVLLNQAIDLAEATGDLDLAWKTIDQLARSFEVDGMDLRIRSLIDAAKAAKTPERIWELGDAACRLMLEALNAGDATTVKKAGAQAQLLAKRTKDKAIQKMITGRADGTAKLAGEIEAVKQARETLKTMPLDAHANQVVGHFELCATGDWNAALPKLTRSDDPEWQKLAASETSLTGQFVDPARQIAVADAWWARAEEEPWPGRHYLHMRAAKWYANAYKSLVDISRERAADRLKMLLATDEGLPSWELFTWRGFQRDAPTGEIVRVETGRGLETAVEFEGAIEVTLVLRTTGDQIRLWSHNTSGGWNFTIQPNRWHTVRYVFTPLSRAAFVDGLPVEGDAWKTARRLPSAPVYLYADNDAIVEVKKFIVKQL